MNQISSDLTVANIGMYHLLVIPICAETPGLSNHLKMENILKQIESKYPVEEILVNGEQVWSYLRIRYYFAYIFKTTGSYGEAKYDSQASRGSKPIRILRFMKNNVRSVLYGCRNWFRKYDYIVLTDSSVRRQVGGKYINRFVDPIIDEIGPNRVLCIEGTSPFPSYRMNQVYNSRSSARTYLYLCKYEKGSSITIAQVMRINRMSAYNALNKLKILGLIELDSKVQAQPSGGSRTEIWRLKRQTSQRTENHR